MGKIIRFACMLIILFGVQSCRNPESVIKNWFDIDISRWEYSVEDFKDVWLIQDGYSEITLMLKGVTKDDIDYLKAKGLTEYKDSKTGSIGYSLYKDDGSSSAYIKVDITSSFLYVYCSVI